MALLQDHEGISSCFLPLANFCVNPRNQKTPGPALGRSLQRLTVRLCRLGTLLWPWPRLLSSRGSPTTSLGSSQVVPCRKTKRPRSKPWEFDVFYVWMYLVSLFFLWHLSKTAVFSDVDGVFYMVLCLLRFVSFFGRSAEDLWIDQPCDAFPLFRGLGWCGLCGGAEMIDPTGYGSNRKPLGTTGLVLFSFNQ